ncbi:MAG: DnaJ domain-containing protein [Cyclobacteriaceae bacterium]
MDHYNMLGIARGASAKEIKTAFRSLAKRYHPDKNPQDPQAEERFKNITEAYIVLSDSTKKAKYDLVLKYGHSPKSAYSSARRTQYYRRKYRPYRRREKVVYSRKAYFLATLTVLGILAFVILFPLGLLKFNGDKEFEEALRHLSENNYPLAAESLKKSIMPFSAQNYRSYLLLSEVMVYQLNQCDQALEYIEKGIQSTDFDTQKAKLSYLQGKCLKKQERFELARQSFENAISQDVHIDSAYYELGELNTYVFKDYQRALHFFDQLISINHNYVDAFFGKAYCHQQLTQHKEAIENYTLFLKIYPGEGMVYYLRSISEVAVGDSIQACQDLNQAKALGINGAQPLLDIHCKD